MAQSSVVQDTKILSEQSLADDRDAPTVTPRFSKKWLNILGFLGGILLLAGMAMAVAKNIQTLPDAVISIDKNNLSDTQVVQLQQVLGSKAQGNFYQADLPTYQALAQTLPWVNQVDVKRDWEKGLVVSVVARQPVAKFGSEKLIDATGKVFSPVDVEQLTAQPWIQLQGDADKSALIMQQTEQVTKWFYPLHMKVEEVILTPRMTWLFRFDNGLRVLVDKDNTAEKLYQLSILLQNQLKNKLPQIATVDLRYKNGMALTWKKAINPVVADMTADITEDGLTLSQAPIQNKPLKKPA